MFVCTYLGKGVVVVVVVVVVVSWFLLLFLARPRSELPSAEVASHAMTTIDTIFMFDFELYGSRI